MLLATLLCWGAFLIVIFSVNPFETTPLGFALFYFSAFFSLLGTFSILGFICRRAWGKNQFIVEQILISFRQAFLFAILFLVSLYLKSSQLMTWWNLIILVLLALVVETYFSSRKSHSQQLTTNNHQSTINS